MVNGINLALPRTAALIGIEMATGDSIEQFIHRRYGGGDVYGKWDRNRSLRLGITGLVTTGPLAHMLFTRLERFAPGTSTLAVLKKVACNAGFMPIMIGATMSTAWFLEGRKTAEVASLLKRELGSAFIAGLGFWPAVNLVIFKSVPVSMRPVVSSGFGGMWGIFLAAKVASSDRMTLPSSTAGLNKKNSF